MVGIRPSTHSHSHTRTHTRTHTHTHSHSHTRKHTHRQFLHSFLGQIGGNNMNVHEKILDCQNSGFMNDDFTDPLR